MILTQFSPCFSFHICKMGVIKVPLPYDYLKDGVRYCVYMVYSTVPGKYQVLKNQCFSTFVVQITCFWISWAASYKFRCLPLLRSSSSEALGVAPGPCIYSKGSGIFVSTIVWKHQRVNYHVHNHTVQSTHFLPVISKDQCPWILCLSITRGLLKSTDSRIPNPLNRNI